VVLFLDILPINYSSFIGVLLVSLSDSSASVPTTSTLAAPAHVARPLLGDLLALLSALFYACYVTLLKVRIGDESRIDMQRFFGFVGLFNIIGLWPLGVVLHLLGVEPFEFPHGRRVLAAIVVNVSC
jgi:solute carrier family 35, member F5